MSAVSDHGPALTRGYPIALLGAFAFSTTGILIRLLVQTYRMPALILAFWRDVLGAVTLLVVLGLLRPVLLKVNRRRLPFLLGFGLLLAIYNGVWTFSVALNGAAVATFLVYSSAGFTALLGRWLLNERLDPAKLIAVALSLAGSLLVSGALYQAGWHANLAAVLTGILSGLCYAAYSLMGRSAAQRGLNPWTTLTYTFAIAAFALLLVNMIPGGLLPGTAIRPADLFWLGNALPGWGILLLLAAGPTVAGYGLYNVSLVYLPSSVANLIVSLEPAITAVIAYVWLGEHLTEIQVAGGLTILVGVVFLRLQEGRTSVEQPSRRGARSRPLQRSGGD